MSKARLDTDVSLGDGVYAVEGGTAAPRTLVRSLLRALSVPGLRGRSYVVEARATNGARASMVWHGGDIATQSGRSEVERDIRSFLTAHGGRGTLRAVVVFYEPDDEPDDEPDEP